MKHNQHTANKFISVYRGVNHYIKRAKSQKEKRKQQFKIKKSRNFVLLYMENAPYPAFWCDIMLWIMPRTYSDFFYQFHGRNFECQKRTNRHYTVYVDSF